MDNKLSELSKPVMYVVHTLDGSVASVKSHSYTAPKGFTSEPLYSQEYVSALTQRIDELEEEFAFIMGQNDGMEKELRDKDARIEHLEAKLATPVRLPDTRFINVGETVVAVMHATSVKEQIQRAGFTVEGDEQ